MSEQIKVVAIVGPTASGKTGLAVRIAEAVRGEIVSVDSLQVYRGMDIGSAKADAAERSAVPHHLLDVAALDEPLDARQFADLAAAAIAEIHARGAVPLLVGGAGLWFRALLEGLMPAPAADRQVRERLERLVDAEGAPALHARLTEVDPVAAGRIHPNDRVRAIRALEVRELTGRTISELQRSHQEAAPPAVYSVLKLGVLWPRGALYARIDARVLAMWEAGFVDEVRDLLAAGFGRDLRPMGALGYKHVCAALAGEISMEEAVTLTQRDTRRYAKRQLVWFNRDPEIVWVDGAQDTPEALAVVRSHLRSPQ